MFCSLASIKSRLTCARGGRVSTVLIKSGLCFQDAVENISDLDATQIHQPVVLGLVTHPLHSLVRTQTPMKLEAITSCCPGHVESQRIARSTLATCREAPYGQFTSFETISTVTVLVLLLVVY